MIVIIWSKAEQRTYITKISYGDIYTTIVKEEKIKHEYYNYCVSFILLKTDCSETSLIQHPLVPNFMAFIMRWTYLRGHIVCLSNVWDLHDMASGLIKEVAVE